MQSVLSPYSFPKIRIRTPLNEARRVQMLNAMLFFILRASVEHVVVHYIGTQHLLPYIICIRHEERDSSDTE